MTGLDEQIKAKEAELTLLHRELTLLKARISGHPSDSGLA